MSNQLKRKYDNTNPERNPGVYLIGYKCEMLFCDKIGYTTYNPKNRLQHLRSATPKHLRLVAFLRCGNPAWWEASLHSILEKARLNGEWFILNQELVDLFVNHGNRRDCNIERFCHELKIKLPSCDILDWKRIYYKLRTEQDRCPQLRHMWRTAITRQYRSQMIYYHICHKKPIYIIASFRNPNQVMIHNKPTLIHQFQTGNPEVLFYYGVLCGPSIRFAELCTMFQMFSFENHPNWYILPDDVIAQLLRYVSMGDIAMGYNDTDRMYGLIKLLFKRIAQFLMKNKTEDVILKAHFDRIFEKYPDSNIWIDVKSHIALFQSLELLFQSNIAWIVADFIKDETLLKQDHNQKNLYCKMCSYEEWMKCNSFTCRHCNPPLKKGLSESSCKLQLYDVDIDSGLL